MAADPLPIGGMKRSAEMVLIRLLPAPPADVAERIGRLAAARVNLSFVSLGADEGRWAGACCVDAADAGPAGAALSGRGGWESVPGVGVLTVFPHRSRTELLRRVLDAFAEEDLPVRSIATSFSTLSLVTDYVLLDRAAAAVGRVAALPENHAPLDPAFRVRQL